MKIRSLAIAALGSAICLTASIPVVAATPLIFTVTGNTANSRPMVEGVTNLPNGTQLLLTLSRRANSYTAQEKLTVQDGRFKSSPFSDRGGALLPGSYTIELVGPITAVQPTARALGPDYKNFSSPLLKRGKLGTTLEYRNTLKIPGQSSSVADANARRVAEQEKAAWVKTSCADIPAIKEQLTGKKMAPPEHEKFLKDCADGKGN